jgi:hypothetical protein
VTYDYKTGFGLDAKVKVKLRPTVSHLELKTTFLLLPDSCKFVDVGRPLWREDGSVFCICCWPSAAQLFSVRVPRDSLPYFTVSVSKLLFSSPPTVTGLRWRYLTPASTRDGFDDWIYFTLCIHTVRDYRQTALSLNYRSYGSPFHMHQDPQSSLAISWQRIYICHFKSHMKSLHRLIPILRIICSCQLRQLDSIQFKAHIPVGWLPETRLFCFYCLYYFSSYLLCPFVIPRYVSHGNQSCIIVYPDSVSAGRCLSSRCLAKVCTSQY